MNFNLPTAEQLNKEISIMGEMILDCENELNSLKAKLNALCLLLRAVQAVNNTDL